jgi:hypothetical protein
MSGGPDAELRIKQSNGEPEPGTDDRNAQYAGAGSA